MSDIIGSKGTHVPAVARTTLSLLLFLKATLDVLLLRKAIAGLHAVFITRENFSPERPAVPSSFPALGSCQQAACRNTSGLRASPEKHNQLQMFQGG